MPEPPRKDARHGYVSPQSVGEVMKEVMPEIEAMAERAIKNPRPEPTPEELEAAELSEWYDAAGRMGIFARFLTAKLDSSKETMALKFVRQFLEEGHFERGRALVLMGVPSIGKSYAAVAALRAKREISSRGWWYFPDLVKFGDEADAARQKAKMVRFAVLDDFGAEYFKKGGQFEAHIDALLAHRHGNMLPTIITTNLTPELFKSDVSERIRERLTEWGLILHCTGPNLRRP